MVHFIFETVFGFVRTLKTLFLHDLWTLYIRDAWKTSKGGGKVISDPKHFVADFCGNFEGGKE